ncbi:NUDIX domain-containing protein [Pseudolysinimonas sp.]|uniref:NUDIX domain-containing protein n=1 Tax=Pseudolysinimonas sp. TaxID=2680009 RepID=UPI00286D67AA|nr:NUDIX domain-containing protein [Pseudolysinimonas sp.]
MGTWQGRLGVAEFAISGPDQDTARIVAARVAVLDDDGAELSRWDWGSDRADAVVGEVAQTLRTLLALGIPIATFDATGGLTVLDRECRRRGIEPLAEPAPILDPLLLDELIEPEFDGARTLNAMAERYEVLPGSLAAGRIVLAMSQREEFAGTPAALHARQRGMIDGWPVVPLDDIRTIVDTQPIPAPAPRPSDTVPMFEFSETGVLALVAPPEVVPPQSAPPPPPTPAPGRIHVAAAIVTDTAGRAIVVRKHGTTGFMQPGGKIERGESALAALTRELQEELGLDVDVDATEFLGSYEAAALNEPGQTVRAEVFALATDQELTPAAEIAEIYWLESPDDTDSVELAPLTLDVMLPLWAARRPALF